MRTTIHAPTEENRLADHPCGSGKIWVILLQKMDAEGIKNLMSRLRALVQVRAHYRAGIILKVSKAATEHSRLVWCKITSDISYALYLLVKKMFAREALLELSRVSRFDNVKSSMNPS